MSQRCVKCGRVWPDSLVDDWGVGDNGAGLGPTPVCPGLQPGRGVRRGAPDPMEACKGTLAASQAQIDQKGTRVDGRPQPPGA